MDQAEFNRRFSQLQSKYESSSRYSSDQIAAIMLQYPEYALTVDSSRTQIFNALSFYSNGGNAETCLQIIEGALSSVIIGAAKTNRR